MSRAKCNAMTKEILAKLLDGREIGEEITEREEKLAQEAGLVVLFGASDDLAELRGAMSDEAGCLYGGGELLICRAPSPFPVPGRRSEGGFMPRHDDCRCAYCGYEIAKERCKKIEAMWDNDGYSWTYKTDIPHATFDVLGRGESDEKYCRGIVFSINDL